MDLQVDDCAYLYEYENVELIRSFDDDHRKGESYGMIWIWHHSNDMDSSIEIDFFNEPLDADEWEARDNREPDSFIKGRLNMEFIGDPTPQQ